jgi:hypothetical protein
MPTRMDNRERILFHWENYKMRQAHVWKSFDRLILAVVILWILPFIQIDLFKSKIILLFFPAIAIFLSIVGRRLLKAEYERLMKVFIKITVLDHTLDFNYPKSSSNSITKNQIGGIIIRICTYLIYLSIVDLVLILLHILDLIQLPDTLKVKKILF